ncbi:MAG: PAS domain S-box protein, partial [Nitrospirota bacterium]
MEKAGEKRRKIQTKVIASILLIGIVPGILIVILTYLSGINSLKRSIGANFQEIAKETADKIQILMNKEVNNVQSLALSPYIREAVLKANDSSETENKIKIQRKYSNLTDYLKEYQMQGMVESGSVLITDKRGFILSSTSLTEDYYQGNKDWWVMSFNHGKGRVFISGIEYDEKAQTYTIAIAVPIYGKDRKNVIGVLRILHDVNEIFKAITNIRIGITGHANLVTSDGTLIVCPIYPPKSHRINEQLMNQIISETPGWGIASDDAHGGKKSIIGFAPVTFTSNTDPDNFGGRKWYVFVRELPEETYAPIYDLLKKSSVMGIGLIFTLSLLGFYVARKIVRPLSILTKGAELIGHGHLEHRIDIKTNDEIEQLSEAFNQMADNLMKQSDQEREAYLLQLRESKDQYKNLFDYAEDSMLMLDLKGKVVAINKRQEEVIGYSKDTLRAQEFSHILSESDRKIFEALFERTLKGEKPPTAEVEILSQTGNLLTMEINLRGIKTGESITSIQVHLRDITKRKILEKEIALERNKLETIIESMGDGLDIVDKNFRIQFMNDKFLKLFGKESIGRTCYEVYTGRDRPCYECPVVKGIEKIGVLEVSLQERTFLITHSPFKNIDGTTSILEIFKDITERKKLERAIRESEELYKNLFDSAVDSMLMVDLKGRIVAINKRQEEVIGYSKDALFGKDFSTILLEKDRKIFANLFESILEDEKPPTAEIEILGQGGSPLTMEIDLMSINRGESSAFVLVHLRDITSRKELEQQLLKSERFTALSHFCSTLAHDLRNPIIGIKKRLEGLQSTIEVSHPDTTKRVLFDLVSGSELLMGMVNDV